jgi:hypothetical protein
LENIYSVLYFLLLCFANVQEKKLELLPVGCGVIFCKTVTYNQINELC